MSTIFAQLMREFRDHERFEIYDNDEMFKYREIGAIMITHVYLNEYSQYEPFVRYLNKTLNEHEITEFVFRTKPVSSFESDGIVFLVFKYPAQAIKVIEIFDLKFYGENAFNGKSLSCKPNGFTNDTVVLDYMSRTYKEQEAGVRSFNAHYYKRTADGNYNYLPVASAHRVVSERRRRHCGNNNNTQRFQNQDSFDVKSRIKYNNNQNNNNNYNRNNSTFDDVDESDNDGNSSQAGTSASFSIKTENSSNMNVSLKVERDGIFAKKRKIATSNSTTSMAKQTLQVDDNDDNDCVIIERPIDLDKTKKDLEEIMGSQPFSCERCGLSFKGSEVIKHRCKKVANDDGNFCSYIS